MKIAPSILSSDFGLLRELVKELEVAGADLIHFDVMDGQFVPPITFGAKLISDLRAHTSLPFEAHLMTLTPEAHFDAFIDAGCERIIFHQEATVHCHRLVHVLKERNIEAGLAINPGTSPYDLASIVSDLDLILVMTVNPGWGGQAMIPGCLAKVRMLKQLSSAQIEIDGGVDDGTIGLAGESGVDICVVGKHLMDSVDKRGTIAALKEV